jgi:hypothetical protein
VIDIEIVKRAASACGWDLIGTDWFSLGFFDDKADGESRWVGPRTEETFAVLAAEKYGLFAYRDTEMDQVAKTDCTLIWAVWQRKEIIGSGTFCEAICQSILYLESKKPVASTR